MSLRPAEPARTHALLIGIETYGAGSDWDLDGPARDVLEMHAWLRSHQVPASHIQTFASPLPRNVSLLDESGITGPATTYQIRRALNALQEKAGDLFVLFWAGHAAINDRQHRLFMADATTADKRNLEWDRLRTSLASTYFGGFPRQIVIVDACADLRNDFAFTAPGESIPSGDAVPCEQFALFAAQPGQTARNLGDERRGLFTRELLRVMKAGAFAASWPPDMAAIAREVETAFREMLADGRAAQLPRFEARDWAGNITEFKVTPRPRPNAASPSPAPTELSFAQLNKLTQLLMACASLSTEAGRNDILRELRPDVGGAVQRRADPKSDIMSMVRTASQYPGGLSELLKLVQDFEGDRTSWTRVEEFVSSSLRHLSIVLERAD